MKGFLSVFVCLGLVGSVAYGFADETPGIQDPDFTIVVSSGGSFPAYLSSTITILGDGTMVVEQESLQGSDPREKVKRANNYRVSTELIEELRGLVKKEDIFHLRDSYIDKNLLDYTGSVITFTLSGRKKSITARVPDTKELPKRLADILIFIDKIRNRFDAVHLRAEAFLNLLRAGEWAKTAQFVLLDEVTRFRIGITEDDSQEVVREKIGKWFKVIYGSVKPGQVLFVRLDPQDTHLAQITYRHDDIDGFNMRFANGDWYYTLDWQPHPEHNSAFGK